MRLIRSAAVTLVDKRITLVHGLTEGEARHLPCRGRRTPRGLTASAARRHSLRNREEERVRIARPGSNVRDAEDRWIDIPRPRTVDPPTKRIDVYDHARVGRR